MAERKKAPKKEVEESVHYYVAVVGIDYKNLRFEPGDVVDGLPPESYEALLEQNAIKKVED